jgi:hypothetical protein
MAALSWTALLGSPVERSPRFTSFDRKRVEAQRADLEQAKALPWACPARPFGLEEKEPVGVGEARHATR